MERAGPTVEGRQLVGPDGEEITLRGTNAVYKAHEPAAPPPEALSEQDIEQVSDEWGYNFIRLGLQYSKVMPERGVIDHQYLAEMRDIVETCADHGIYVLLDMHQDMYGPAFGGDGFPDWTIPDDVDPVDLSRETYDGIPWPALYFHPGVDRSFSGLYNNENGVRDDIIRAYLTVVEELGTHRNVIGIEPLNEPFPGTEYLPDLA
ncbi:MAG: cellulase family glycosylhydrolase, partial [Candidatus Nanohaloarchaea archaeon]